MSPPRTGDDRSAEIDAVEERAGGGREERAESGEREARGPPNRTTGPLDR